MLRRLSGLQLQKTLHRHSSRLAVTSTSADQSDDSQSTNRRTRLSVAVAVGLASAAFYAYGKSRIAECRSKKKVADLEDHRPGEHRSDLPTYTTDEVSEHYDGDDSLWVTYKNGVYDITDFLKVHPGDDKILMAAGGRVDPFWTLYPIHMNPHVYKILEQYRIGNIEHEVEYDNNDFTDQFVNQPEKKPLLILRSAKPYNGETPPSLLIDSFITPTHLFYVRSHFAVPPPYKHITLVNCPDNKHILNIADFVKDYKHHSVIATVQCCGNRRAEMHAFKPVKGGVWASGSIGNAEWSGVKLADVLQHMGVDEENTKYKHVIFEGGDGDGAGTTYSASIPIEMAMDPRRDVLLCTGMNGEPLSRHHGGPVRVVVPGVIGARQVKWLKRIILSETESDSQWQVNDYKVVPSSRIQSETMRQQPAIYTYPVQSSICRPQHDDSLAANTPHTIVVEGYAWSGGGRGIRSVELSIDDGLTWQTTELNSVDQPHLRRWAWSLYRGEIRVAPQAAGSSVTILARAIDDSYCSQHRQVAWIWNARGLLHHTIPECTLHFE